MTGSGTRTEEFDPRDRVAALRAEMAARWNGGDRVLTEALVAAHPDLSDEDVLVLLLGEVVLRWERGETPTADEYARRFPHLAADIPLQFELQAQLRGLSDTTPAAPAPVAPVQVPGYEILEELGRGGVAVVYRARHTALNRIVALKTMLRIDPIGRARFLAEAEVVAAIHHPHVVQVFDFGDRNGTPYLAMEYLPGGTLAARLADGKCLPPADAARLMAKVAAGVAAAHALGIVHRDLKPSNVLLDESGEPKVADFGLAKRSAGSDLTATQALMGTPAYMAPEQVRGAKFAGPPADVWALGATLYHCLTGHRPFDEENLQALLNAVQSREPVPVRVRAAGVPRDLDTIVSKCLTKEPDGRYPTARELADDLDRFCRGESIAARPAGLAERAVRWARRKPAAAAAWALGAGVVGAVAVAGALAVAFSNAKRERENADGARSDAETALGHLAAQVRETEKAQGELVRAKERLARSEFYRGRLAEARTYRTSGQLGQRFRGLAALRAAFAAFPAGDLTPDQQLELRDEATACLALPDLREVGRRRVVSTHEYEIDCDDRFGLVCFADYAGRCTVVRRGADPATDVRLASHAPFDPVVTSYRKFSPDGRFLAEVLLSSRVAEFHQLRVWDWAAKRLVFDGRLTVAHASQVAFHPSAPALAAVGADKVVRVIDLTSGAVVRRSARMFTAGELCYSPDGRLLAVSNDLGPGHLLDAQTLDSVETIPDGRPSWAAAWSPDGGLVAFGLKSGDVYVWDRAAHRGRILPATPAAFGLWFSPDGRYLACGVLGDQTRLWDVAENRLVLTVSGRPIRFGRDGCRLAVADGNDLVEYELAPSPAVRSLHLAMEGAEFSPDGAYLALSGVWGVRLFAADTLEPRADLGLYDCGPVAFHPNGREVLTVGRFVGPWKWPIRAEGGTTVLGPAAPAVPAGSLALPIGFRKPLNSGRHAAWSRDGTLLAVSDAPNRQVRLIDPSGKRRPVALDTTSTPERVAVSPDGRWVAVARAAHGAQVWSRDGTLVPLDLTPHGSVAFSPDGKWLACAWRNVIDVHRVGTWERTRSIPRDEVDVASAGPLAFQPGTGLLAAVTSRRHVRLYDPETGRAAATLTHTEPAVDLWLGFSPDGTRLAVTREGTEVAVWDLVGIGAGLAEFGLPAGPFSGSGARSPVAAGPITVHRGGELPGSGFAFTRWQHLALEEELRGNYPDAIRDITRALDIAPPDRRARAAIHVRRGGFRWQLGEHPGAVDDWLAAAELDPENVEAPIWLARVWTLGQAEVRSPLRAVAVVSPLVDRARPAAGALLYHGIAQVRLGRYRDGLAALDKVSAAAGGPVRDYFRALALHHLGESGPAKDALGVATAADERTATGRRPGERAELAAVRDEVVGAIAGPQPK